MKKKEKTYTVRVPSPTNKKKKISITIIKKSFCSKKRKKNKSPVYCGNKKSLPRSYRRHGKNYECLRKGFGAGMCSIYK